MRRIAEGIALGFITCCALTLAAVIAAIVLHRTEIPLLLSVHAALPQGLPEVELTGNPFGFMVLLVLVAAAWAVVTGRRSSPRSGTPIAPDDGLRSTDHPSS